MKNKPIFIGSSSGGLKVAESIQILLSNDGFDTMVWNQGIFGLGKGLLEELVAVLHKSDFGIFVLRSDDLLISKNNTYNATRDNVLFELGLYIGYLGRLRTFIVYDNSSPTKIIEDLKGVIYTSYDGAKADLNIALGPAVSRVKQEIYKQLIPKEILYTEWHLGAKKYIEKLLLSRDTSENIIGSREYEESGGQTQIFSVKGFQGRGFYWLEYHRPDGKGGGTIMLHDIGTGNFNGLITAGHCDTSVLRCYKNRWVLLSDETETISYDTNWLEKIGEYK
jgi:Predicted nucleotide-binding protein containing TIR-like domain